MSTIIVQNAHQKCLELHNFFYLFSWGGPPDPNLSLVIPKGVL